MCNERPNVKHFEYASTEAEMNKKLVEMDVQSEAATKLAKKLPGVGMVSRLA